MQNPPHASTSPTPVTPDISASPVRSRAWILALIWIPAAAWVAWVWWRPAAQLQSQIFKTYTAVFFAAIFSWVWVLAGSGWPWKKRLKICGGSLALTALVGIVVRIDGVNGDLVPVAFSFRWQLPADARLGELAPPPVSTERAMDPAGLEDWPQFLGPERRPVREGWRISEDWQPGRVREIWRISVGAGWSGFAVRGERLLTQEQRGDEERVSCYEAATGRLLWTHRDQARYDSAIGGVGPRATPTIDDHGRVYSLGATGILNALDLETGRRLWSQRITDPAAVRVPDWGYAGSPLIAGEKVVVSAGGTEGRSLLAFDRESGELKWSGGSSPAAYCSPMLAELAGVKQILILNLTDVSAHDPETGRVLWSHPWPGREPKVAQPLVLAGDRVLLSSGYGVGAALLQVEREGSEGWRVREVWKNLSIKAKFANMVDHGEYVYALDDGILTCVNWADGRRLWKDGRYRHGQLVRIGDRLLVQTEGGELALVEARPDRFSELARFPVFREKTWNSPALAGRYLFLRNDHEAVCLEMPVVASLVSVGR